MTITDLATVRKATSVFEGTDGASRTPACSRLLKVLDNPRFVRARIKLNPAWSRLLEETIASHAPVRLLLLWGKGPKKYPDRIDHRAVKFLARYAAKVVSDWTPGVRFRILFADTHAQVNGYPAAETEAYFTGVRRLLHNVTQEFGQLSDLWRQAGLRCTGLVRYSAEPPDDQWPIISRALQLVEAAQRYARFGPAEEVARQYYCVRRVENSLLTDQYTGWVFATSDSPERAALLPGLPLLHLYSWARGRCAKPWLTLEKGLVHFPPVPILGG